MAAHRSSKWDFELDTRYGVSQAMANHSSMQTGCATADEQ